MNINQTNQIQSLTNEIKPWKTKKLNINSVSAVVWSALRKRWDPDAVVYVMMSCSLECFHVPGVILSGETWKPQDHTLYQVSLLTSKIISVRFSVFIVNQCCYWGGYGEVRTGLSEFKGWSTAQLLMMKLQKLI